MYQPASKLVKVAVIKCQTYDLEDVGAALSRGIDLLGGIDQFCQPGEKILLKPNLLAGDVPEKGVTTHPAVFAQTAKICQQHYLQVYYGDSPAKGNPERTAQKAGIKTVADHLHIPLADFRKTIKKSFPQAQLAKQLSLAAGILEMDGIISLSKMKTHALTRITGAIKNQFGYIPGLYKSEYHVKMPDIYEFSRVLVDINLFLKPRLFIMDGIEAMEGNGPRGGEIRKMNVLLISQDPVALDATFCKLINLNPEIVPFMKIAAEAGLGTYREQDIDLIGDPIESLIQKKFKVVRRKPDRFISAQHFPPYLKSWISAKPVINYRSCINCGSCVVQCPVSPKAVNWGNRKRQTKPSYNYKDCIRCYCCQEICPEKAIRVKTPLLGKIIPRIIN